MSVFEELATEAHTTPEAFPLMPIGQAVDMGYAEDGTPLFDPRILDSIEFFTSTHLVIPIYQN